MTKEEFYMLPSEHLGSVLEKTLEWAADRENFDPTFVESLYESYEKWGDLTERQRSSLYNILVRFETGILHEFSQHVPQSHSY